MTIVIKMMMRRLDDKSLVHLKKVSRGLYEFLEEERFYWLRVIQSYYKTNIKKYKSWKKLVDKTPSEMIKKLALALHQFIHLRSTSCQKQWPPGTVSERMSFEQSAISFQILYADLSNKHLEVQINVEWVGIFFQKE